jgi:hypothetical protein
MKSLRIAAAAALALLLAACATSSTKPVVVQTLNKEQVAALRLKDVTAVAAPGVSMSQADFDRICFKVKKELQVVSPGIIVDPASPEAAAADTMKITFTQYDSGSAFARAMLIGLGQIHVDADVAVLDPTGASVGQYKISKQFALGGLVGATTSIEDVEDGFAKSVSEIAKK